MSASSAFSVPAASICASCKPTLLCSDGCGAAAVHSVCRGSREQQSSSAVTDSARARGVTEALLRDRCIGHGHTDKSVRACTFHARMRTRRNCLLRWQHATSDGQHATFNMQHATCNMQRTTSLLRPSHVWQMMRDDVLWYQALAPLGRPTCTARGAHLVKRRTLLLGLQYQTQSG